MPVDQRFYRQNAQPVLQDLIVQHGLSLSLEGRDIQIQGLASSGDAGPGDLCFFEGARDAPPSWGGVCLIRAQDMAHAPKDAVLITSVSPRADFAKLAAAFFSPIGLADVVRDLPEPAIHPEAIISPHGVVIGRGVAIGAGTRIGAHTVIGPGVQIGRDGEIEDHVTLQCALIGDRVRLKSGARIGGAGFGVTSTDSGLIDMPHFGRAILQDEVSIGANSCVDRGMLGDTVIGEGTRIDNLCHIAHNVLVGRHVVMAAFAGISGSVTIGDGVMMGGRCGIADHVTVGDGARLAASIALYRNVPAGETWGGVPGRPQRQWLREMAWLGKATARRRQAP